MRSNNKIAYYRALCITCECAAVSNLHCRINQFNINKTLGLLCCELCFKYVHSIWSGYFSWTCSSKSLKITFYNYIYFIAVVHNHPWSIKICLARYRFEFWSVEKLKQHMRNTYFNNNEELKIYIQFPRLVSVY